MKEIRMNISTGERKPSIIKKMISLVDKESMGAMMSAASSYQSKKPKEVTQDMVMQYLNIWADAKYELFLLFGKNLSVDREVMFEISPEEIRAKVETLSMAFPKYALVLSHIKNTDIVSNTFSEFSNRKQKNEDYEFAIGAIQPYFKKGKKLSTCLSELFQDEGIEVERVLQDGTVVKAVSNFNIELSKIMQTTKTKGKISISINPCDYLMMSTNKHNWNSCMGIVPSCTGHASSVLSKMCDESSIMGFKASDTIHKYDLNGVKFDYISMQARYILFYDKNTSVFAVSSAYGGANAFEKLQLEICGLLKESVSTFFGVENSWSSISDEKVSYSSHNMAYNDGIDKRFVHKLAKQRLKICFDIGVPKLICPVCGKERTQKGNFSCC